MSTSRDNENGTIVKLDSENMGTAVGILLLFAPELEICLGVESPPTCRSSFSMVPFPLSRVIFASKVLNSSRRCFVEISVKTSDVQTSNSCSAAKWRTFGNFGMQMH